MSDPSRPLKGLLSAVIGRAEHRFALAAHEVTGISEIDEHLAPLEADSGMVVTAARAVDSTTLALQIALRAALGRRHVTIIADEGCAEMTAQRVLALASGVDGRRLLHGRLSESDWARLGSTITKLEKLDVAIAEGVVDEADLASFPAVVADRGLDPVVVVVRAVTNPQTARASIDVLQRMASESHFAWVVASPEDHELGTATGSQLAAGGSRDVWEMTIHLRRADDRAFAEVVNGYGWSFLVEVHDSRDGRGFFGLSRRPVARVVEPDLGSVVSFAWG